MTEAQGDRGAGPEARSAPAARRQSRAPKLNRRLHRIGALVSALPVLVVVVSGLFLQLKKEWTWVQPATVRGSTTELRIDWDAVLASAASVEEAGIIYTNQTDAPVSPLGSLHKIRVAVARDLWKEPDTILAPQERVSVESAIRAVTINAAWQCHSEHEIGSLEVGKFADFVVLDEDPRRVEPTAISDIGISETWMNGEQTFRA